MAFVALAPENQVKYRDRYLDLLRAIAIVRVVFLHSLFIGWVTFLFPSMGIMFALGGSLMASSLERSGNAAILRRFKRLLPPMWLLGAILVPLMLLFGWASQSGGIHPFTWHSLLYWALPVYDPPGSDQFTQAWIVLWYLRAYLWFVALSPALLWCFKKAPWVSVFVPLGLMFLFPDNFRDNGHWHAVVLDLTTYMSCWMLGYAHHFGLLSRISIRRYVSLVSVVAAIGVALLIAYLGQPRLEVTSNPVLDAFWSTTFVLVLLRIRPSMAWLESRTRLNLAVSVMNRRAITIYLWHIPAIAIAGWGLERVSSFDPTDLGSTSLSEGLALLLLVGVLVSLATVAFGWVEDLSKRRVVVTR